MPGKKSLVEKVYGSLPAAAGKQEEAAAQPAEGAAEREEPRRHARGTMPVPIEQPPLLPIEVTQAVQARHEAVQARHGRTAPGYAEVKEKPEVKESAPAPEEGETVAHRAPRRRPQEAEAVHDDTRRVAAMFELPPPVRALSRPAANENEHEPSRRVLEELEEEHEVADGEEEADIPLEDLDEEQLDEVADEVDLELPEDATLEQKRRAIAAARAARQGKALKGMARQVKKVAGAAADDEKQIDKKGKAQGAAKAAQGQAAAGAAKAAAAKRSFSKAKNLDELKARLRKVMEEDKKKLDDALAVDSDALKKKLEGERTRLDQELKALDQKVATEIAAKEKEIAAQIQTKQGEAKARAENDRRQAQATCETEKARRRQQAAAEASRLQAEGADPAAVAAARSKGEQAAQELDAKLAATLDKIGKAEVEGAAKLEQEKTSMIADAQAKAKTAHEEGKAKVDAALVKVNEEEKSGLDKLKAANDAMRKQSLEKFDAQMKKLESGSAEELAALEAETNKIIGEIDQEVLRFQAMAQQQTQLSVQAAHKAADVAIAGVQEAGKQAIEKIDALAKEAMDRVDRDAAEAEARQAAVAAEGQRRLTASTPEEAAAVERDAAAREKAEQDKVDAEVAAKKAEEEKIKQAAAAIADELDATFDTDEEAILAQLRGKTPEQIALIKQAYFEKTHRQLDADIGKSGALDDTEMKEAKAHLSGDPVQRAVATLTNAEDGWTGEEDEARIKETLAKLDPETRKKVAAEYEKQTGRRLNAMLEDELDEDEARGALVPEDPKKKVEVSQQVKDSPAVAAAVAKLKGATTGNSLGTDEAAVMEALKGKTPEEIEAIKQVWNEKHGPPGLDAVLEDEMSGTDLKEAKAMMSDDPVQKAVASLQNASDGMGTDKAKLQATLEGIKDPVLRAQVAAEYEKQTGEKLDDMLVGELSGRDLDKAQAAAAGDLATLRAIKFDEAKNSSVIGDLAASASSVLAEYGIEVDPSTIAMIADIAIVVAMGPVGLLYGAALLADEHLDLRDDENAMYHALEECETPEERKAMEEAYNKRYAPKTLRGEIGKLDGAEIDVATALLDGDKAKARAAKVKAGSEQLLWADKDLMFSAIEECESKEERDALIAEFNKRYGAAAGGTDYEATLDESFKYNDLDREKAKQLTEDGKMDEAFALFYAQHAGLWGTSGTGLGTDEEAIAKILKGKSKEEIEELKKKYAALAGRYGREPDLGKSLDQETSGRTGKQIEMLMRGEPTSAKEALERQEEMEEFEREDTSGWAIDLVVIGLMGPLALPWIAARMAGLVDTDEMAKDAVDCWNDSSDDLTASQARLRDKLTQLDRDMKKNPGESDADFEKRKLEAFKKEIEKEQGYLDNYKAAKDATADAASTGVGLVVTAALSIASGGAAAWAAAAIGGLAGIGAKAAILGGAYETEDFGMDLLNVAAEAIAAGVAKGVDLDKAVEGLKALGASEQLIGKVLKEALEEAIENGTSALILALFDENNYKSPEAFLFGVAGAVGQAALSGAVAAAVTVSLGELFDQLIGAPGSNKGLAFLKGAITEGVGGLAASAVDPTTWEGNMEAVLTRFGKGFIDNILSAGAEGIGEAVGHAIRHGKVEANQKHLASQGVDNTAVVSGHIVDLDSGRVFDGEKGTELGRIAVDPQTGMVFDVTDPANPVPIGVNDNLKGARIGGVDTNAQAGGSAPSGAVDPGVDAEVDADVDSDARPTVVLDAGPTQADIDEATAKAEAGDKAAVDKASVEKARALLAGMTGDADPASCLNCATKIATQLAMNGIAVELFGDATHYFLKIGDTVIDGSLYQFFNVPDGFAPPIFIGSMDELRGKLSELEAAHGIRTSLLGDMTVDQLFDTRFGGASANSKVLDVMVGKSGRAFGEFKTGVSPDAGRIDTDVPLLADASSIDPDVGFGEVQQARARAALEGMSDADYLRMRTLLNTQGSDTARAYILKALAAGNSVDEIARFASKIHGKPDTWLKDNLTLADPGAIGAGVAQQSKDSCNAAMLIAMMADLDPVLALRVRENPDAIELLARLERQMLETRYQGDNKNAKQGQAGVAVPIGFDAQGRGRFIDDYLNAQSKWTGIEFTSEMNPTPSHVLDVLDVALGAGVDVPVVVGNADQEKRFAHYVLATGRRVNDAGFTEYRFYDPATGSSTWVAAADILAGQVGLSGYSLITGLEVPTSVAISSDPDADAAPDTERDPTMDDEAADTERDPAVASDTAPGAAFDAAAEVEKAKSQSQAEREQILGMDPKRGFIAIEGEVGAMIEAAHGYFMRDPSGATEWISLSGPDAGKSFDHLGLPPGKDQFHGDDMANFLPQITRHFDKADVVVLDTRFMRPKQVESVMSYIDQNHINDKHRLIVL